MFAGCAGTQKAAGTSSTIAPPPETALATSEVDPEKLHTALLLLADQMSARIAGTTTEIAARTSDPRVREQTILFKLRAIPVMYTIAYDPDPRAAYLHGWIFLVRMRMYLTVGQGRTLFGDQQPLIVDAAVATLHDLVEVGYRNFPREVMDEVSDDIEAIAAVNPIGVNLHTGALQMPEVSSAKQRGAIDSILGAPVRGLEGVGSTPEAIHAATRSFEEFMRLIQQMPQYVRWQTELLLLQVESQDAVVQTREDLDRISRSIESIATTVSTLPADLRKEINEGLDQARVTITALDTSLDKAGSIAADVNEATANIQQTAETVNEIVAAVVPAPSATPPVTTDSEPFDMKDVLRTTEQLLATTVHLRGLVADIESGGAKDLLAEVNRASTATIDHAVAQANVIVDRLTWRVIYLIGALVLGLIIYRVVAVRLIRPPAVR